MPAMGQNLGVLWTRFVHDSMGLLSRRASRIAMALGIFLWIAALAVSPVGRASIAVLELFAAIALAYELPALVNRKHWPVQAMFRWWHEASSPLNPARTRVAEDPATRVDALIAAATGEPGTWDEVRALAVELRPAVSREHVLAMADLFEKGGFHTAAFDAALAELPTDEERRHWRVRLALTEAFAGYVVHGDYLPGLLQAASREGPFALSPIGRARLAISRYMLGGFFLVAGLGAAGLIAIAFDA
jgi:hypothetical protein